MGWKIWFWVEPVKVPFPGQPGPLSWGRRRYPPNGIFKIIPPHLEIQGVRVTALATADLNGDDIDDLIVGGGFDNIGYVVLGSNPLSDSIDVTKDMQDLTILPSDQDDRCGMALASGDLKR